MAVIDSFRRQIVPVHREGYPFIAAAFIIALILMWLWAPLGWIGIIIALWCVYFFRDPPRVTPMREGLIISPADGTICAIGYFMPPPELGLGAQPMMRVSIFMSIFDCHVNRMPIDGKIRKIAYRPGLFLSADLDKASEDNERCGLVLDTAYGTVGVVQIAGLIARRIVTFVQQNESLGAGDRFGLIRFGSRLDVYLPHEIKVQVGVGAKAVAGETILADLRNPDAYLTFKCG